MTNIRNSCYVWFVLIAAALFFVMLALDPRPALGQDRLVCNGQGYCLDDAGSYLLVQAAPVCPTCPPPVADTTPGCPGCVWERYGGSGNIRYRIKEVVAGTTITRVTGLSLMSTRWLVQVLGMRQAAP